MSPTRSLSRRKLVGSSAGVAAASAVAGKLPVFAAERPGVVHVTAILTHVGHSRMTGDGLRVGVRVSVRTATGAIDRRVMIVDPLPATMHAPTFRDALIARIRSAVSEGIEHVRPADIPVQLFGGML